jgi:hypothetical protein
MKWGPIFAATGRGGANFPDFLVARRWQTPGIHPSAKNARAGDGMRRFSLLELEKNGLQRRPRES